MITKKSVSWFLVLCMTLSFAACSDKGGSKSDPVVSGLPDTNQNTNQGLNNGAKLNVSFSVVTSPNASPAPLFGMHAAPLLATSLTTSLPPFRGVSARGAGLESLKLFITDIQICSSVTRSGTAVQAMDGCLFLYRGPDDTGLHSTTDLAGVVSAATNTTTGFIDVMDPASRAALSTTITVTGTDAHDYHYGIISWAPPVKVKATLVDPTDGVTPVLYTKPGAAQACSVNNNPYDCVIAASPLSSGPAEEAVFAAGGNIIFKFQKPLTITADDVANSANFSLRLAFNPDGLVQGVISPGATNFPPLADNVVPTGNTAGYNVGNSISLVGAQVAAIFSRSTATVMRESYTATLASSGSPTASPSTYKLRVEFYSLQGDPDRTVYGVNTATLPTADTSGYLVGYHGIYGITTNADDSVNLLDYQGNAQVRNLARITVEGGTTTAQILCEPVSMDCTPGETVAATFTLDALQPLD